MSKAMLLSKTISRVADRVADRAADRAAEEKKPDMPDIIEIEVSYFASKREIAEKVRAEFNKYGGPEVGLSYRILEREVLTELGKMIVLERIRRE